MQSAPTQQPTIICILGMHRSGTSCLTGSLQQAGLYLGNHSTWNPFNRKGNRENADIMALHEDILRDNNGAWNDPPAGIQITAENIIRAREIVAGYGSEHSAWGFKDPRSLLVLEMWQQLIPGLQHVGIFRHPMAVAKSLQRRGFEDLDQALNLWAFYNKALLDAHAKMPFPIISFDWSQHKFHAVLNAVICDLGLSPIADDQWFYSPELHTHSDREEHELPASVRQMYKALQDISAASNTGPTV